MHMVEDMVIDRAGEGEGYQWDGSGSGVRGGDFKEMLCTGTSGVLL